MCAHIAVLVSFFVLLLLCSLAKTRLHGFICFCIYAYMRGIGGGEGTSSTSKSVPDGGCSGHLDDDDDEDVWEAEERRGHCSSAQNKMEQESRLCMFQPSRR